MTGGSDGLVGTLLKYGSSGMVCLLQLLFDMRRLSLGNGERALRMLNLFKKGDKEYPGIYYIIECCRESAL